MPNWCSNRLTLRCTDLRYKKFIDTYVSGNPDQPDQECIFNLQAIDPTPDELLQVTAPVKSAVKRETFVKKYGAEDWYEWRIRHWGTKWIPEIHTIKHRSIGFDSAWSPPVDAVLTLSKQMPAVEFTLEYCEPGNGVAGCIVIQNGEQIECDETDRSNSKLFKMLARSFGYNEEE